MGDHPTFITTKASAFSVSRPQTPIRPRRLNRDFVCFENRHRLGVSAPRNGVRQRDDLLAVITRLAESRGVGQNPSSVAATVAPHQPDRFFPSFRRFRLGTSRFWGAQTGPNPTDRRKKGSKHHVLTDGQGIPLAKRLTGAHRHDVTQLLPLVEAIPNIAGKRGRPCKRPKRLYGDRAYDSQPHRQQLRQRGIQPSLARRRTEHGSGLGVYRWVVERTISWLHQFRRLKIRHERRADIHEALLTLGCVLICWNFLSSFC